MSPKCPIVISFAILLASCATVWAEDVAGTESPPALDWKADYRTAYREAIAAKQMLFLFARDPKSTAADAFAKTVLDDAKVRQELAGVTLCELPLDFELEKEGEREKLFTHDAFRYLRGGSGIVLIDLRDEQSKHFGNVVSTFPLRTATSLNATKMLTILRLPPGTLTQRTLIYAVRTHPENPGSAKGTFEPILAEEVESHAMKQATINLQGHHAWETRFHRINGRLGRGLVAREVCAESWPGQDLIEAAEECVHSWRQSPGHWEIVSANAPVFGYDMKLGTRGIWYGTGIMAR